MSTGLSDQTRYVLRAQCWADGVDGSLPSKLLHVRCGDVARHIMEKKDWEVIAKEAVKVASSAIKISLLGFTQAYDLLDAEVRRARMKFPRPDMLFLAMVEECGEVEEAILNKESPVRTQEEAVQVACTALRLYEEGDPVLGCGPPTPTTAEDEPEYRAQESTNGVEAQDACLGLKDVEGKPPLEHLPVELLEELYPDVDWRASWLDQARACARGDNFANFIAPVLEFGAQKYSPENWRHEPAHRYVGAFRRHKIAALRGQQVDHESGLPTLAHAAACAVILHVMEKQA